MGVREQGIEVQEKRGMRQQDMEAHDKFCKNAGIGRSRKRGEQEKKWWQDVGVSEGEEGLAGHAGAGQDKEETAPPELSTVQEKRGGMKQQDLK